MTTELHGVARNQRRLAHDSARVAALIDGLPGAPAALAGLADLTPPRPAAAVDWTRAWSEPLIVCTQSVVVESPHRAPPSPTPSNAVAPPTVNPASSRR